MASPQEQFTELWHAEAPHVMAFARRHVGAEAAHDVVAETFTIAWRRWGDLPTPPTPPIAWLLVTARKVIQNRARTNRRHRALEERIALLDGVAAYGRPCLPSHRPKQPNPSPGSSQHRSSHEHP